jgi:hypothetical protein
MDENPSTTNFPVLATKETSRFPLDTEANNPLSSQRKQVADQISPRIKRKIATEKLPNSV